MESGLRSVTSLRHVLTLGSSGTGKVRVGSWRLFVESDHPPWVSKSTGGKWVCYLNIIHGSVTDNASSTDFFTIGRTILRSLFWTESNKKKGSNKVGKILTYKKRRKVPRTSVFQSKQNWSFAKDVFQSLIYKGHNARYDRVSVGTLRRNMVLSSMSGKYLFTRTHRRSFCG